MTRSAPKTVWRNYFSVIEFFQQFSTEDACENEVIRIKFGESGFKCSNCECKKYYKYKSPLLKRRRLLECVECGKQTSLTKNTLFENSKIPLLKWFIAIYEITQTKKGISACRLSRKIKVSETTARIMLYKIRAEMEENAIEYQVGGPGYIVEIDEIEIGGKGKKKQNVLIVLEKEKANERLGRVRFAPMPDKSVSSIELNFIPLVKKGTNIHSDGKITYKKLATRYHLHLEQVSHVEENYTYSFLQDLNTIVGNLKNWYKGTHHSFSLKNTSYYLNEFAYRFNRRRIEKNIFERLLTRSITRAKRLKVKDFYKQKPYLPLYFPLAA